MEEGASSSPYCDPWWWESQLTCSTCRACNGYYGPCFSEPVCATCHAFLYASSLEQEIQLQLQSEEANDSDDDGEKGAGNKLASLLDLTGAEDCIVMVSRWYGES